MRRALLLAAALWLAALFGAASPGDVPWPVNGGVDNIRHSSLAQITRENVARLQVAWTYDSHDAFTASEMQSNPIVVDGVLYATTPTMKVVAIDAATGAELWKFDPSGGAASMARARHRGVTVDKDRVFVTYRSFLYALDRKTGRPILTFGATGRIDLREGLDQPVQGLSVSASTPGSIFEDTIIVGTAVPETLPGSPGHIRAFDVNTGKVRWIFHTIPKPGEMGYETWPPEAYKLAGGANAWAGVTVDTKNGLVFAATGSASFDFYGVTRHGDNLFADCVLALDARTGKYVWHFQGIHHDVWDYDFPAAPSLVTVRRDGRAVDAVAQTTKYGYVYVLDRRTGAPLFPIEMRKVPASTIDGEQLATEQPYPTLPVPFARQGLTEAMLTTRTREAHADVLARFTKYSKGFLAPPSLEGTIVFPGFDGGAEWGGAAFDPDTALFYVNSNEMPWIIKLIPNNDTALYNSKCATCHREDRKGGATAPSLIDVGTRLSRDEIATIIRQGTGRMPGFPDMGGRNINDVVDFLHHGQGQSERPGGRERSEPPQVPQRRRVDLSRSRRLSRDHAAVGHAERARPEFRANALEDSVRRVPRSRGEGPQEHRQRQLRRPGRDRGRRALHRRHEFRQEVSRLRQAHRQAPVGGDASGRGQRHAGRVPTRRTRIRRHRLRRRQERRAVRQRHRRVRAAEVASRLLDLDDDELDGLVGVVDVLVHDAGRHRRLPVRLARFKMRDGRFAGGGDGLQVAADDRDD